jgi:uncharacterized protein YcsI (UPF0317 family)
MKWLRMIPSEEARQSKRGTRRYFEIHGEPIDISSSSGDEDDDLDDDDEGGAGEFMEAEDEEGVDILVEQDFANHE